MARRDRQLGISFFAFQDIITSVVGIFILITMILALELVRNAASASVPAMPDVESLREVQSRLEAELADLEIAYQSRLVSASKATEINEFNRQEKTEKLLADLESTLAMIARAEADIKSLQMQRDDAERTLAQSVADATAMEAEKKAISDLEAKQGELKRKADVYSVNTALIYGDVSAEGRYITVIKLTSDSIEVADAYTVRVHTFSRVSEFRSWLSQQSKGNRQFFLWVQPEATQKFEEIRSILDQSDALYGFDLVTPDQNILLRFQLEQQQ